MQRTVFSLKTGKAEVIDLTAEEIAEREAMQPTPEQLLQQKRAGMVLTPAQARLKLASIDMLTTVNTAINALSETDAMRIKWEYATQIERLDPDLIEFCVQVLGIDDAGIDSLFE